MKIKCGQIAINLTKSNDCKIFKRRHNYRHPQRNNAGGAGIPASGLYHPSAAGLNVHGKKLPDLYNEFPPDNQIPLVSIPESAPGIVAPGGGYHKLKNHEWNIEWEFRIFGYIESLLLFLTRESRYGKETPLEIRVVQSFDEIIVQPFNIGKIFDIDIFYRFLCFFFIKKYSIIII